MRRIISDSLLGTCSVPCAGNGWTTTGRAGGETIRPITLDIRPDAQCPQADRNGGTFHFVTNGIQAANHNLPPFATPPQGHGVG
jgi:hypothetical protein